MTLTEAQVEEIESAFEGIVGLPLVAASLYAPGPLLWFAEDRDLPAGWVSPQKVRATWTLALACAWGIEGPWGAIRADDRPWEISPADRIRLAALIDSRRKVLAVGVRQDGILRLDLAEDEALLVIADRPSAAERDPRPWSWSLRPPRDDPQGTLSLGLGGLIREPARPPPAERVMTASPPPLEWRRKTENVTEFGLDFWDEP